MPEQSQDAPGMMIQLRWVGYHHARTLQYRFRLPYLTDPLHSFPPEKWHWSEWHTVEEPK